MDTSSGTVALTTSSDTCRCKPYSTLSATNDIKSSGHFDYKPQNKIVTNCEQADNCIQAKHVQCNYLQH